MKIAPVVETYDRIVREVKFDLVVVGAGEFAGGNKTPVVVKAIWDTGAYGSVISPKVASELGLTPVGVKPIQTANGSYRERTGCSIAQMPDYWVRFFQTHEHSKSDNGCHQKKSHPC